MSNRKYTKRPAICDGFYWLIDADGIEFPAQYLGDSIWSTVRHDGLKNWEWLVTNGYMRSIRRLNP